MQTLSKTFKPNVVVVDYETALLDGTPSLEYYREDFRVTSSAFAWRTLDGSIKTVCFEGEDETREFLTHCKSISVPIVVHNFQFEYGVTYYRFPGLESCLTTDTMRLVQVGDNGGKMAYAQSAPTTYDDLLDTVDSEASDYRTGLSLVAAASRWLPEEWHNHKEPTHAWLRENAGAKKGKEWQCLTKLPPDMLKAYNVADVTVTLLLHEALLAEFTRIEYNPWNDHRLYLSSARYMAVAKGIGIDVDRLDLMLYATEIQDELAEIERAFRERFAEPIAKIEAARAEAYVMGLKTEKGRQRRRDELETDQSAVRFNVGSNTQLAVLFKDTLGIRPKFWTKVPKAKPGVERKKEFVPSPSFKSAHLSTYGDGGSLLRTRRKRLLVLKQAQALLALSRYDGKWHFNMRACGTATGRFSGGSAV